MTASGVSLASRSVNDNPSGAFSSTLNSLSGAAVSTGLVSVGFWLLQPAAKSTATHNIALPRIDILTLGRFGSDFIIYFSFENIENSGVSFNCGVNSI